MAFVCCYKSVKIMSRQKILNHIGAYHRDFKKEKRTQYRALAKQIEEFRVGIALTDDEAYKEFIKATEHLDNMYKILKVWWKKA